MKNYADISVKSLKTHLFRLWTALSTTTATRRNKSVFASVDDSTEPTSTEMPPFKASFSLRGIDEVRTHQDSQVAFKTIVELPSQTIGVPAIRAIFPIETREAELYISAFEASFTSVPVWVFSIENAIVHSSAGIIACKNSVISETTWHTAPNRQCYSLHGTEIEIGPTNLNCIKGTFLSLLTGSAQSYWHTLFDGAARIQAVPEEMVRQCQGIFIPQNAVKERELLELWGVPKSIPIIPVSDADTIQVEQLILPWTLHGLFAYHPILKSFFERLYARATLVPREEGRRIYIDRRDSPLRKLLNEEALIEALKGLDFVTIQLESLSLVEQIGLFSDAECVVALHGAGLSNIGFARQDCLVIELMMDANLNWCYRRLSALLGLRYDCVVGEAKKPWAELNAGFHSQVWEISVEMVVCCVSAHCEPRVLSQ